MAQPAKSTTGSADSPSVSGGRPLTRSIGILGAAVFGILCIGLTYSGLLPFSTLIGMWPGSSLVGILAIALVVCLVHAYTFAVIGSAVPRSGADYILSTRTLSAPLGFLSSWLLVVFSTFFVGSLLGTTAKTIVPMLLNLAGRILNTSALIDAGTTLKTPEGVVIFGTVAAFLAFATLVMPVRTFQRILLGSFVLVMIAWVILFFQFGTAAATDFPLAWDRVMGEGGFDQQIALAKSLGMVLNPGTSVWVLGGLTAGLWVFFGAFTPVYAAGEVKNPGRTLLTGSWISLLISFGILAGASLLLQRLVSPQWLSAESYLYLHGSSSTAMPWLPFYGAILNSNIVLIVLVIAAWVVGIFNLVQTYLFFLSRIVLAWAQDGLLPAGVSYLQPESRSPLIAVLILGIAVILGVIDAALGSVIGSQINFVFWIAFSQLIPVLAVTLFPFLRKESFEKSSALVRLRVLGIPLITIMGSLTFIYLVWLVIASGWFVNPGPSIQTGGVVGLVVLLIGLGIYLRREISLRRAGKPMGARFPSLEE